MLIVQAVMVVLVLSVAQITHAETYVGGMVGYNIPNRASNTAILGGSGRVAVSDTDLSDSALFGLKLGHYFDKKGLSWLGVEGELYTSQPSVLGQSATVSGLGGSAVVRLAPIELSMTTLGFNAMMRYPGERWQPYAGLGLGVFLASLEGDGRSSTPGFNGLVGLRYKVTEQAGVFGEYKYAKTSLSFDTVQARYSSSAVAFGVSWHF